MTDRAEQAKALIADAKIDISDADRCILLGISPAAGTLHRRLRDVTAALSASEVEVTRLRAGIAEALAEHEAGVERMRDSIADPNNTFSGREYDLRKLHGMEGAVFAIKRLQAALSQPTTDTNGAHA